MRQARASATRKDHSQPPKEPRQMKKLKSSTPLEMDGVRCLATHRYGNCQIIFFLAPWRKKGTTLVLASDRSPPIRRPFFFSRMQVIFAPLKFRFINKRLELWKQKFTSVSLIYRFEFLGVCVGVHATPTTLDPNRGDTAAAKQSIRNNTGLLEPIAGHYFRRRFRQFLEPLRTNGHTASSLRP